MHNNRFVFKVCEILVLTTLNEWKWRRVSQLSRDKSLNRTWLYKYRTKPTWSKTFLTGKKICVFLSKGNFWTKIDVCPNIFFSFWGIHVMIRPICIWPSSSKSVNVKWSHDFWLLQCPRHTLLLHSNFQSFQVNFLSKSRCCCNTTFD